MEKIRILCYGDSNTWGYIPGTDHQRYDIKQRYTKILSKKLGHRFEVIEEGLNARTLISNDQRPGKEGKSGYEYLLPCLDTHSPIDLVVLMLGTNELKADYNKTPDEIGKILEAYFIRVILNRETVVKNHQPRLLIIAPPIINEQAEYKQTKEMFYGATEKSKQLNEIYKTLAQRYRCAFIGNEKLIVGSDGVHLSEESHKYLGNELAKEIKALFKGVK